MDVRKSHLMSDTVQKWLRQQSKDFYAAGIDAQMRQVYMSWWRICKVINVLSTFEYHIFYVLYLFVIYLLTLRRISYQKVFLK
jgi:hypothetical protein